MDFNNLTDAQKMILFGQVSVLLGSVLISLGNLLAMSEPPSQPMYGSVGAGSDSSIGGNSSNSANQYFF